MDLVRHFEAMGIEDIRVLKEDDWPYIRKIMTEEWSDEQVQFFVFPKPTGFDTRIMAVASDSIGAYLPNPRVHVDDLDIAYKYTKERMLRKLRHSAIVRGLGLVDVDGVQFEDGSIIVPRLVDRPITFMHYEQFDAELKVASRDGRFYKPYHSTLYEVFKRDPQYQ